MLVSFFKGCAAHLFIATHAFALLNSVPTSWILIAEAGRFTRPPDGVRTLLANESALAYQLYAPWPHVVEREVRQRLEVASIDELKELFNIMGESALRYEVYLKRCEQDVFDNDEADDEAEDDAVGGEGDEFA